MTDVLLSSYSWYESWSPILGITLVLLVILYHRFISASSVYRTTLRHYSCFYAALVLFYMVKGSPLALIANYYSLTFHLLQLGIIFFAVIPLMILSMPTNFIRQLFWHHRLRNSIKIFSHPWIAALTFNIVLTIYLMPAVFKISYTTVWLSMIWQIVMAIAAFLMWWTIIAPIVETGRYSYFTRVAYVFLNSLLLMPIGIFLIFNVSQVHYPLYSLGHELFHSYNPIHDQQIAGAVLKSVQLLCYGSALFYLIFQWGKEEKEREDLGIRIVQEIVIHMRDKK